MADALTHAEDRFIEAIGSAIEFWGFKSVLGHVWAWLYLSEEPRDAAAIGRRLRLSKAAVSTSLKELERWGCVRRFRRPGQRRELFEAETDVWTMVSRVFRDRELPRVRRALEVFDRIAADLGHAPAPARARAKPMAARVERLAALARVALELLTAALEQGLGDLAALSAAPDRPRRKPRAGAP